MFDEQRCLENLKQIISEYAVEEDLKNLSQEEFRSSYTQLADNLYHISVSNRLKYKNMLWNIDQLKPEIRTKFQAELFNTWHSIYKTSLKSDPIKNFPESENQDPIPLISGGERPEIGEQKDLPDPSIQERFDSEKQKIAASNGNTDLSQEKKPQKKQSRLTASKASGHQFENDWFDKLLDFFAAIVGCLSGMTGR